MEYGRTKNGEKSIFFKSSKNRIELFYKHTAVEVYIFYTKNIR